MQPLPAEIEQTLRQYVQQCCSGGGLESLQFKAEGGQLLLSSGAPLIELARLALPIALPQLAQEVLRWQAECAYIIPLHEGSEWRLDLHRRVLCSEAGEHPLTDKEATLLQHLLQAAPNALTRAFLLDSVWRYDEQVDTHTLESHIYRLRQKLEPTGLALKLTTDAQGYRWCGEGLPAPR